MVHDVLPTFTEQGASKTLHLRHLSPESRKLLSNAEAFICVNVEEGLPYALAGEARVC